MSTAAITTIFDARAAANEWLIKWLPDRFASGVPEFDESLGEWRIPVWLSYPQLEPLGPVGEVVIGEAGGVKSHTPLDQIRERARELYEQNREQIEAPVLFS